MTRDGLHAIQCYTARAAITSSSMRGAATGTVPAARNFLGNLSLKPFGTIDQANFASALDTATNALLRELPKTARHWGRARKGLNIFLRGALYTCYLRDEYDLGRGERFFETPLDSITGKKLFEESVDRLLPAWATVRDLDQTTSAAYQRAADKVAGQFGIARVHLDAIWWGRRSTDD